MTVQILPAVHYQNASNALATVTIADDEKPMVRVAASGAELREGSGTNGTISFLRDGDTRAPLTVNFTLTGSATNGVIYQTLPTTVTFAIGASATNLTVIPINNTNYSGTTTGIVTVVANAAYVIVTNAGSDRLIFRDDDLPVVNIVATDPDAREAGLNPGRFTITRTGATFEPLPVYYRVSGTAEMGNTNYSASFGDYQALTNVLVLSAGQSAGYVDIIPIQNTVPEPMKTVILTLAGSANYRIGATNAATVNLDDDDALTYQITVERPSIINAGNRPGVIKITRTGSALAASSLPWSVTDLNGTPLSSGYTLTGDFYNGNLYFAVNQSTATVKLQHLATTITNLQFRFAGQVVTLPCWGADRLIQISANPLFPYAVEGDSGTKARFQLNRLGSGSAVTVQLRFEGTATPGVDFVPTNFVTFSNNVSSLSFEIYALPDSVTEGWESLIVRLETTNLTYAPYNSSVSADAFQETYAVLWLREAGTPGTPPDVDTDGDLLTDRFELAHGLNPLRPDDFQSDADKDGLSLLEEQTAGTDPAKADSDGDGVNDFFEVSWGGNPTNATQVAAAPLRTSQVLCLVGDDSGSESELWQVSVGGLTVNNAGPGQVVTRILALPEGSSNVVRLRHLGSVETPPDLDYHLELRSGDSVPPAFLVRDPQQLLGLHADPGDGPDYAGKTAVVLVPQLTLTWTNKGDNLPLDMNTNGFSGEVQGQRIFVGGKTPSDNNARNTVLLQLKTTPPLAGSNVWLRCFDVDDTTDDKRLDNQGVIDPNGTAGNDNFPDYLNTPLSGLFVSSGQATNVVTLNANGEATVEFRVGMQPGNNYRIAATVFRTNNLSALQVTNATANGFVPALTDEVKGGFNGKLSPLLTVWRKLHLEIDSMTAVPTSGPQANFVTDNIWAIRPNRPNPGQTEVYFGFNNLSWQINQFENGTLTIPTAGVSYPIVGNGFVHYPNQIQWLSQANVIVSGLVPTNLVDAVGQLRDDDDSFLADWTLPPALPMDGRHAEIVNALIPTFRRAFVEVIDANAAGLNPAGRTQIPFILNYALNSILNPAGGHFSDVQDLNDSALFWTHTVCFGYQGSIDDCNDPSPNPNDPDADGPTKGVTPKGVLNRPGVSGVYVESLRDVHLYARPSGLSPGSPAFNTALDVYKNDFYGVVAHEIGHEPGNELESAAHNEDGIMMKGAANLVTGFAPKTILRFRKSTSWAIPPPQ